MLPARRRPTSSWPHSKIIVSTRQRRTRRCGARAITNARKTNMRERSSGRSAERKPASCSRSSPRSPPTVGPVHAAPRMRPRRRARSPRKSSPSAPVTTPNRSDGSDTMITSERTFERTWENDGFSRIPYWLYTHPAIFEREMDRLFYHGHWCYAGLSAEIPHPGDFKRTSIGERSVIMVRDRDGTINVVANRCAHRGVQFCQKDFGNGKTFVSPYHQSSHDLKANLIQFP